MLECVVNISSADNAVLTELSLVVSDALLDVHSDEHHNRSVFTLAGPAVGDAARALAAASLERLDLREHFGVHPRLGVVDVVPFVPIAEGPSVLLSNALAERNRFARYAGEQLGLSCFLYGPERTLPEVRREAFVTLAPDFGPAHPDPSRGSCCVGAREALVAFNLVLESDDLAAARAIARAVRSPQVRALGLQIGEEVQVSCNLVDPFRFGPDALYDEVARYAPIRRCELVGLVPAAVYNSVAPQRRAILDLDRERTIEARIERAEITTRRRTP